MLNKLAEKSIADTKEGLFLLGYLTELHEWDNRKHLERISRYVFLMADAMGLATTEAISLSLASVLHDVGKYFTPKELLLSGGNLNQKEWKLIEKHTTQGSELLQSENSFVLQTASTIALTHHERWDGSGYPRKLVGEAIPTGGCICAVADVFDALTTYRPYKKVVEDEIAFKMIKDARGTLFNPEVISAFDKVFLEIQKVKKTCE
jgi:putative two-component system response regulator